jgi:hypothetical protein
MKTYAEQIKGGKPRVPRGRARGWVMEKAGGEGVVLDAAKEEEHDTLASDLKASTDIWRGYTKGKARQDDTAKPPAGARRKGP